MKVLITGANGFIGQNLIARLVERPDIDVLHHSTGTSRKLLERNLKECDFLFHFAAVHRPKDNSEFYRVNDKFFGEILTSLENAGNKSPVLLTSSIQATDNNDYGRSKRIAEDMLKAHALKMGSKAIIYRLLNTFGPMARPNVHSVVATFCHNIARDLPITISSRDIQMRFYYIDDVIDSFEEQLSCTSVPAEHFEPITLSEDKIFTVTLGQLADKLLYFRECEKSGATPECASLYDNHLLKTYLSYHP